MRASILLEDGTHLEGVGHGVQGECVGEFVFNTAMTGYEEVLTDPSYRGQIVVFTTSHIGNTGITLDDSESSGLQAAAFVCKEFSPVSDNQRTRESLQEYLVRMNKFAVSGIDTRYLTRVLRERGCMLGIVSLTDHKKESLLRKLKEAAPMENNSTLWQPTGNGCDENLPNATATGTATATVNPNAIADSKVAKCNSSRRRFWRPTLRPSNRMAFFLAMALATLAFFWRTRSFAGSFWLLFRSILRLAYVWGIKFWRFCLKEALESCSLGTMP
jgi:hypothetical protein